MNDLISVIVPVYNVEKYLVNTVDSIINQTYKNIEIILVDDGSNDSSGEICDSFKDDRVRVFHKDNSGPSECRNFGIKKAKGKYISFIDADDLVHPSFLECLYDGIVKCNANIAAVRLIEKEIGFLVPNNKIQNKHKFITKVDCFRDLCTDEMFGNYPCNKLFEASLFNDIEFPKGNTMEDLGIMYKVLEKVNGIAFCDEELYYYIQRKDSIIHKGGADFDVNLFCFTKARYDYYCSHYPEIEESYIDYLYVILQTYKTIAKRDDLLTIAKKDTEYLLPKVYNKLSLAAKIKLVWYGLNS